MLADLKKKGFIPMYEPSIAVLGVLKPNPTSLYHLRPPFPTLVLLVLFDFWLTKICGCFWKARSDCTVNSVAIFARWLMLCRQKRRFSLLCVPRIAASRLNLVLALALARLTDEV